MRKTLLFLLLSLAAPVLADQGHAHGIGRPGDPAAVSRKVEIVASDDMRFKPSRIAVRAGETLRFIVRNTGRMRHELVLGTATGLAQHAEQMRRFPEMEHDDPHAVSVEPGQTAELVWQFTRTGSVHFACLLPGHYEAGMRGRIAVHR